MRRIFRARALRTIASGIAFASSLSAAQPQPAPQPPATNGETDALFQLGERLFNELAPPEIKAQYEFPTKERWDDFFVRLQRAFETESLEELASFLPESRAALDALRLLPDYQDTADWLEQRIDELEAAQQLTQAPPRPVPTPPAPTPTPTPKAPTPRPSTPKSPAATKLVVPHYDLWVGRVRGRPLPARAAALMPRLRTAFAAEGIPGELAWLAEAESSLNPNARSPVGAKGLFQLMPETAKSLGLDTFLPDERTDPDKSAHAAARYLRSLHQRFGSWPLALAAYNAGEGRVSRAMTKRGAKDYAGVAEALPAETRMYVPKVHALIAARTGLTPDQLPAPRAR